MRALITIHRYLGIAVGLVMALWCASGIVMMYVSYPSLDNSQRLRALQPIAWSQCCAFDVLEESLGKQSVEGFNIEMVAGRPVLRVVQSHGVRTVFDLRSGNRVERFSQTEALSTASRYLVAEGEQGQLRYRELNEPDQWTVGSRLSRAHGLAVISLGDVRDTELYISSKTGDVVLNTTARERFWNWLGPVAHWLYPAILRKNAVLWSQVVIWISLLGAFLTAFGIYIGVTQWRRISVQSKGQRASPYVGVHRWHHVSGLIFGVLLLVWVFSGFLSMNPWGLLESAGPRGEQQRLESLALDGAQLTNILRSIVEASRTSTSITRLQSAPLNGNLYLLKYTQGGNADNPQRVAALTLQSAPLSHAEIAQAATEFLPDVNARKIDLLTQGDAYYHAHHDALVFPVYRVVLNDSQQTRYYLDANSAAIVAKFDVNARRYRWWFEALHRWDFIDGLQRPWWDALVLSLLLGATAISFTGAYMAYRQLIPKRNVASVFN